jgi:hypothetical protein
MSALIGLENAAGEVLVESGCKQFNDEGWFERIEETKAGFLPMPAYCKCCLRGVVDAALNHPFFGAHELLDKSVFEHARALGMLQ